MHASIVRFTLVIALVITALLPVGTAAQQLPAPLTGESFFHRGSFLETNVTCNPNGESTITFRSSGVAAGPYPGTYTESGTIKFGPQTTPIGEVGRLFLGSNTVFVGPVTEFRSTFRIQSPVGEVTGTKELVERIPNATTQPNYATCLTFRDQNIFLFNARGEFDDANVSTRYEAKIQSPLGTFVDRGFALAQLLVQEVDGTTADGQTIGFGVRSFSEHFLASTGVVPTAPATVELAPPTATNEVGTSHTVTATVRDMTGNPVPQVSVLFTVAGASSASGACTTNAAGQCSFTYEGPELPGADLITAFADTNKNGQRDPGEPAGTATKVFILPASTPGQVTGGGYVPSPAPTARVAFGFTARNDGGGGPKGTCTVVDHASNTLVKCLDVVTLVQVGSPTGGGRATFFGNAEVNGQPTTYRIDVDDLSEPNTADTFKIQTDAGYAAGGVVEGGNIQVHR